MATRFAGDFFGIPLVSPKEDSSRLFGYFPELKSLKTSGGGSGAQPEEGGARLYGGAKAVAPFTGFKTFEVSNEKKAAPLFSGFKTFEQPKPTQGVSSEQKQTVDKTEVNFDPEVLKFLGLAEQVQR